MPVCPMALLVFIDFFTELQALVRSASGRLRGKVKTVVRALALAATPRPTIRKVLAGATARL